MTEVVPSVYKIANKYPHVTSLELQIRLTKPDVSDSDANRCFAHAQFDSILAEYLVDVVDKC